MMVRKICQEIAQNLRHLNGFLRAAQFDPNCVGSHHRLAVIKADS